MTHEAIKTNTASVMHHTASRLGYESRKGTGNLEASITKDTAQALSEIFEKIADLLTEADIHAEHRDFARDMFMPGEFVEACREYDQSVRMANTLYDVALKMLNKEMVSEDAEVR